MTGLTRFTRVLDWNLLKYFIQIAERGGIGAAADSMHISQPSVSAALRRLEDQLGVQLFIRTRKGARLTDAGHALRLECETILGRLSAAPAELRAIAGDLGGSVFLKTLSCVMSPALDAAISEFKSRYPKVELILETGHADRIVESLLSGDASIAVGFDEDLCPELGHALLMKERQQLYCAPGHRLYGQTVSDFGILEAESFVALSEGEPPALRLFRKRYGVDCHISGLADTVFEAAWLISLGIGIGHLPEPVASSLQPTLAPLLPRALAPELDIYLMWRRDLQSSAALRLVKTIIEKIRISNAGLSQVELDCGGMRHQLPAATASMPPATASSTIR
jgi:DNA-binding transcriptional LysR family regulator